MNIRRARCNKTLPISLLSCATNNKSTIEHTAAARRSRGTHGWVACATAAHTHTSVSFLPPSPPQTQVPTRRRRNRATSGHAQPPRPRRTYACAQPNKNKQRHKKIGNTPSPPLRPQPQDTQHRGQLLEEARRNTRRKFEAKGWEVINYTPAAGQPCFTPTRHRCRLPPRTFHARVPRS